MKICPKCNSQVDDNVAFCPSCGMSFVASAPNQESNQQAPAYGASQQAYATAYDPYDHTLEFEAKDISDNKVIAMLAYLLGTVGIIVALLASSQSKYAGFHVRQALKFTVVNILLVICCALLFWTIIIPILAGIAASVLFVVKIISFIQVCQGKAKEPYIIRSFGFLK